MNFEDEIHELHVIQVNVVKTERKKMRNSRQIHLKSGN